MDRYKIAIGAQPPKEPWDIIAYEFKQCNISVQDMIGAISRKRIYKELTDRGIKFTDYELRILGAQWQGDLLTVLGGPVSKKLNKEDIELFIKMIPLIKERKKLNES
jgi:hypothetical protein